MNCDLTPKILVASETRQIRNDLCLKGELARQVPRHLICETRYNRLVQV